MTDFWFGVITCLVVQASAVGAWFGGKAALTALWAKAVTALKAEVNKL